MNRRTFVSSLAVAGAAVATGSKLFSAESKPRLRVGVIGCGWYGGVDLGVFQRCTGIHVVSLADPNKHMLANLVAQAAKTQKEVPATFADYREMLAHEPLDVVIVTTPDHWHALPAIAAMKAGADLYLEKPVSVDVIEGEALVAAARKYNRVVQVNTQRRSGKHYLDARDKYITSGRLGTIGLVETYSFLGENPTVLPDVPVPEGLDYNLWVGPAPKIPYRTGMESRDWRPFMEFGNGPIGNLGVHMIDKVRFLLGLGWPESVACSGGIFVHKNATSNTPDTQRAVFKYPGLDVSWEHRTWGASPIPPRHWSDQWGARFIGEKGTLNMTMFEYVFTPAGGGAREGVNLMSKSGDLENIDLSRDAQVFRPTEDAHVLDFLHARENRSRPVADIEQGHISSSMCELGNISMQLGRTVAYDPKTRTVSGDTEATALLARPYRGPWLHPTPENV